MPVLTGTPSMVVASTVQVHRTCTVDLTWQRSIHSCQRCPRAVVAVNLAPITQSNVERASSRFCPAGVHMGKCVPATDLFWVTSKSVSGSKTNLTGSSVGQHTYGGLNISPSAWGPPNLPAPAASLNHPVHAAHARLSYPPSTTAASLGNATEATDNFSPSRPRSMTAVHHHPVIPSRRTTISVPSKQDESVNRKSMDTSAIAETIDQQTSLKSPPVTSRVTIRHSPEPEPVITPERTKQIPAKVATVRATSDKVTFPNSGMNGTLTSPAQDTSPTPAERKTTLEATGESREPIDLASKRIKKEDSTTIPVRSRISATDGSSVIVIEDETKRVSKRLGTVVTEDGQAGKGLGKTAKPVEQQYVPVSTDSTIDTGRQGSKIIQQRKPHVPADDLERQQVTGHSTPLSNASGTAISTSGIGDVSTTGSKHNGVSQHRPDQNSRALPSDPDSTTPSKHQPPIRPPAIPTSLILPRKVSVPSFHFPFGSTRMTADEVTFELDRAKKELLRILNAESSDTNLSSEKNSIPFDSFGEVAKALNCPLYWKYPIYSSCGGTSEHQPVPLSEILKLWKQILTSCPDETARFVHLLSKGRSCYLVQSDFNPLIQDILESHPGLAFLQAAKDFHSRYVSTVVSRIFFNVNASWTDRISLSELRKSNFLSVLASLEDEEDINVVTQYFSYEHFYVIYCKFWELDEDHDLIISKADLSRHNNYSISERMIDRIFSGTVTSGTSFKDGVMSYPEFVWFLLAEEDKRHPRSIEYWFRCMDLDGDGLLSMYELEHFYSEQMSRMEEMGIEPISFEDCLCQCLDMVKPELGDKIRLSDLKKCRLCHIFFDTFFNLPKYLQHEQRDPFSNLRDIEEGLNELSDWERYAAEAYELLVSVDNGNQDDDDMDDEEMDEDDVLDPSALGSDEVDGKEKNSGNEKVEIEEDSADSDSKPKRVTIVHKISTT